MAFLSFFPRILNFPRQNHMPLNYENYTDESKKILLDRLFKPKLKIF